jgi:hypothetical protein
MSRILIDDRHHHILVLLKRRTEDRGFGYYNRVFEICDDRHKLEEFKGHISNAVEDPHSQNTQGLKIVIGILNRM